MNMSVTAIRILLGSTIVATIAVIPFTAFSSSNSESYEKGRASAFTCTR
jgi:hypothetical protein